MIISFIAHLIASLTTLPILAFGLLYILFYFYFKNKREALQWSLAGSTFFLIFSVSKTIEQLWNFSLTWLFILLVLFIALGLTYMQFKLRGQISYNKLIKGTFAVSFLLFLPLHVLLYLWVIFSSFTYSVFGSS